MQKFRGFISWLRHGSELKLRHLSIVKTGYQRRGLVSSGTNFLSANVLPIFFLRRSLQKFRGNINWLRNGSDFKFRHLSFVIIGDTTEESVVQYWCKVLVGERVADFCLMRSVQKLRRINDWLRNGSDLNFRHLSIVNRGYRRRGFGVHCTKIVPANVLPNFSEAFCEEIS